MVANWARRKQSLGVVAESAPKARGFFLVFLTNCWASWNSCHFVKCTMSHDDTDLDVQDLDVPEDASAAQDLASWLGLIARIGKDQGHFTPLGDRHWSLMTQDGPHLLVTFDTIDAARQRAGQMPQLYEFASTMGWSYLCLIADGQTWFRDPAVYAHFDELIDDAVFDGYDRVTLYGAGMAGYAAAAYSVAAPGATVLAISPRATMAPSRVPFEVRDRPARRLDFTSRFGFAPDMVRAASQVWILRDPHYAADAAQSALFQGRAVHTLNLRHLADKVEVVLSELDILPKLIAAAMKGEMSADYLARLWRDRRNFAPYLRRLLAKNETARREGRAFAICSNAARRIKAPEFQHRLDAMIKARDARRHPAS